jgi:hypothetical protein
MHAVLTLVTAAPLAQLQEEPLKNISMAIATFAVLAVTGLANAQERSERADSDPAVEVTPYVSVGSATSPRFGAAIRWAFATNLSAELEAGKRPDVNGLALNFSLLYDLPKIRRVTPYIAGGVGLDQYGDAFGSGGDIFVKTKTAFAVNAGGGVRAPIDDNWGVRADARWFGTFGKTPDRWRMYNGVTFGRGRR